MAFRTIALAAFSAAAMAGAAQAQEGAIATAPGGSGAPMTSSQEATNRQIDEFLNRPDPEPALILPEKRAIHGEVGAAIGTGGYRSAYAVTVIPVGQSGELGIAYEETRLSGRRGRGGGGSSKSLSVSLSLDKPLIPASQEDCIPRTGVRLPSDDARTGCRRMAQDQEWAGSAPLLGGAEAADIGR